VRGQAVQRDRVGVSTVEQRVVQPERGECLAARVGGRRVVPHRHPDVGVDRVRAVGCRRRVRRHAHRSAVARDGLGQLGDLGRRRELARRRDHDLETGFRAEHHQRVRDVVAVADVDQLQAVQPAEPLLQRHQVRQRLARVVVVGEHVDDGDARVGCELLDRAVRPGADRDRVHEPREHQRGVAR
jgi:hypothetical protein